MGNKENTKPCKSPTREEMTAYFMQKGLSDTEGVTFYEKGVRKGWWGKDRVLNVNWKERAYQRVFRMLKSEPWRFNRHIH